MRDAVNGEWKMDNGQWSPSEWSPSECHLLRRMYNVEWTDLKRLGYIEDLMAARGYLYMYARGIGVRLWVEKVIYGDLAVADVPRLGGGNTKDAKGGYIGVDKCVSEGEGRWRRPRSITYFNLDVLTHQFCLVHLIRNLQYLNDTNDKQEWSGNMQKLFRDAIHEWNEAKAPPGSEVRKKYEESSNRNTRLYINL